MENIILIDAYSQIFRCYYAVKAGLTNPQGQPTNALYGIARLLLQLDKTRPSAYGAVCFDKGRSTRRCTLLPEYKAQRAPMPEDLRKQVEPIKEWMTAFGWTLLEEEGIEADDLIAAVTNVRDGRAVAILTHDKDIAQLMEQPDVELFSSGKNGAWETMTPEDVVIKFGVTPAQLGDYLALLGDAVDNIRGIDGVGSKTAAKLLTDYGSIDGILAALPTMKPGRVRDSLQSDVDHLRRNRSLVALDTDLPKNWTGLSMIRRRPADWDRLKAMAEEQGFKSILPQLDAARTAAMQPTLF